MPFDELGQWKPNKKQEIFLSVPNSIKEAFYGGGAGSGKSEILLVYPLVRGWHQNPRFKQVFMRRTYVELRNEIVPRSREFYLKFGAHFNKSEMSWCFPREDQYGSGMTPAGAMIYLAHCENESDVHNYDSMEINLYTPDELTSFVEFIYLYIGFTRVRTSDPTLPAIIRAAGMPGGIGHSFVKKRFVDPFPEGGKVIVGRGGNKRIYIHSTLADNSKIDPAYSQSLEALPEAEKRAKKFGDWSAYLGQVFDEFRSIKYPDEPENALHVIEPFEIPAWWPRFVTIDWGFSALTYVTYTAVAPNKRAYVYREQSWRRVKIEEWAPFVREFIDSEHPRTVKVCKSAGQDRGQTHTIQEQIELALGKTVELSNNSPGSRVAGKMLLHEYLRWKPKHQPPKDSLVYREEYAQWVFRNQGIEKYKSYLATFNPAKTEDNLPKLQIFDTCPLLINAIKSCVYDKTRIEDVAEFDGDDPYDNIRYVVDTIDRYFIDAESEFKKVQTQDELSNQLAQTQDWTSYYRNARRLEAQGQVTQLRRYRHR